MEDDELTRTLSEWTGQTKLDDARRRRLSQRLHEHLDNETSTWSGLLFDAYERSMALRLDTVHGRTHTGVIATLGHDFIALSEAPNGNSTLVPMAMITSVQVDASRRVIGSIGNRATPSGPTFSEILSRLADNQAWIRFAASDAESVRSGEIVTAGLDVIAVATVGPPAATVFIPMAQLSEVSVAQLPSPS